MTRKEQIENQASEYANDSNNILEWGDGWEDYNDFDKVFDAFKNGAKWADANPQFSKEKFIEKSCWWLRETAYFYVSDFTGELDDNGLIEDFKKAMKE